MDPDPYLEKLKAQLAIAEARNPKNDVLITRYKNEIQRVEKLAVVAKGAAANVKGLHAATAKVTNLVARSPQSKPAASFGATAMAHTPASATPAVVSKPDLKFWERLESKIADGTIYKDNGRSYDLSLTPAQKAELAKMGGSGSGSGSRSRSRRQRQRRRSARNKKIARCHSRRSRRHH